MILIHVVSYCIIEVSSFAQGQNSSLKAEGNSTSRLRCWHITSADWSMLTEEGHCSPQALRQGAPYAESDSLFFGSSCIHYVDIFDIITVGYCR